MSPANIFFSIVRITFQNDTDNLDIVQSIRKQSLSEEYRK